MDTIIKFFTKFGQAIQELLASDIFVYSKNTTSEFFLNIFDKPSSLMFSFLPLNFWTKTINTFLILSDPLFFLQSINASLAQNITMFAYHTICRIDFMKLALLSSQAFVGKIITLLAYMLFWTFVASMIIKFTTKIFQTLYPDSIISKCKKFVQDNILTPLSQTKPILYVIQKFEILKDMCIKSLSGGDPDFENKITDMFYKMGINSTNPYDAILSTDESDYASKSAFLPSTTSNPWLFTSVNDLAKWMQDAKEISPKTTTSSRH